MKVNKIDLYKYFGIERPKNGAGYLNEYIIERNQTDNYTALKQRLRPAMLVIAGGGYSFVSEREKEPIAIQYLAQGYNAFTLEYSVKPIGHPYQLLEGCMAMVYIREHAKEYHIIENKVGVVGFSAGGHLTGMLATYNNEPEIIELLGERAKNIVPNAVVFSYAVITLGKLSHQITANVLSYGKEELKERFSIEKRVNKNSAPAFIWTTKNDGAVPMENSTMLAKAYENAGVPYKLVLFEQGIHGLALANEETVCVNEEVQQWLPLQFNWLKNMGFKVDIEK